MLLPSETDSGLCSCDIVDNDENDDNGDSEASRPVGSSSFESSPSSADDSNGRHGGSGEGGSFTATGKSLSLKRISSSIALLYPLVQLIIPSSNVRCL